MTTLVTGSEGYVGSRLMKKNPEFIGCDIIKTLESTFKLDLTQEDQLLKFCVEHKVDVIIHLAGAQYSRKINWWARKKYFHKGNVLPAVSIKNVAEKIGLKQLIFLSTDMVYGKSASGNILEDSHYSPYGPYGKSKLKAESIFLSIPQTSVITIFRPRLIIGAGRTGTIAQLRKWINSRLPVPIIGSGENRYQFIAVDDVIDAIDLARGIKRTDIFNLGSDNPPKVKVLIPAVMEKLNRKPRIMRTPPKTTKALLTLLDFLNISPLVPEQFLIADQDFVLNTSKFQSVTGWKPKFDDSEMLFEALQALDEIHQATK